MAMTLDGFSLPEMVAFSTEIFEGRELEPKDTDLPWRAIGSLVLYEVEQPQGHKSGCSAMLQPCGGCCGGKSFMSGTQLLEHKIGGRDWKRRIWKGS